MKMARFILTSQYVICEGRQSEAFRVDRGSGMGLSISGDFSNLCFHDLVEVWSTSLTAKVQHGILMYMRFMDDGLIVARDDPSL